jgi:hypothetical protein
VTGRVDVLIGRIESEKRLIRDSAELSDYVDRQRPKLSAEERLQLCAALVRLNIFDWLDYVGREVKALASTDMSYIGLLAEIVTKVRRDMAQGPIIEALISIGESSPDFGLGVSEAMRSREEEGLVIYSSYPLGGSGRINFAITKPILASLWASNNPLHQVAAIRAYRVILIGNGTLTAEPLSNVFDLLHTAAKSENLAVRQEAANALFDLAGVDEKRSVEMLESLLRDESSIRAVIARRLQTKSGFSTQSIVSLLKLCCTDDDDNVLSQVAMALAFRGRDFPQDAIEMVLNLLDRGKFSTVPNLDFASTEITEVNPELVANVVDQFLRRDHSKHLEYGIQYLLAEAFSSDYSALARPIKGWLDGSETLQRVALRSLDEVLGRVYETKDAAVADTFYPFIESYARKKGINVETVIRRENDKVAQCLELVREAQRERKSLNYAEIRKNWGDFVSLREFIGDAWIEERELEKNQTHEILRDLARLSEEPGNTWSRTMLAYLDDMSSSVKNLANTASMRRGIESDEQFQDAFSELQVADAFVKAGYPMTIEPMVGNKRLDFEVVLDDTSILIEVVTPHPFRKLKYASGGVSVPNRARSKIFDEFKKHLSQLPHENRKPAVIVMNITNSDIDYDFVADYLYGTLQFSFWTDKSTGKIVDQGPTRAADSLSDLARDGLENLNMISGVICYKTIFAAKGKIHLSGQIFLNPTAQNPLSKEQVSKISRVLFRKTVLPIQE